MSCPRLDSAPELDLDEVGEGVNFDGLQAPCRCCGLVTLSFSSDLCPSCECEEELQSC